MSDFIDFLKDMIEERLSDIDIGMIGRIEAFDAGKMRADVTPLMKKKSGDSELEYAVLKDIPVNFLLSGDYYIRPEYKKGDLVHIAFSTHDIEEALRDRKPLASERIFSSENAFIVGGVAKTGWTPPAKFSEQGLLIGHRDGTFIHIKPDEIDIKDKNNNETKMNSQGIKLNDANGNTITLKQDGITLKTEDSAAWCPNSIQACLFTGAPHGGPSGTPPIIKLKGS